MLIAIDVSGSLPTQAIGRINELMKHLQRFAHPNSYVVTFSHEIKSNAMLPDFDSAVLSRPEGGTNLACVRNDFGANRGLKLIITDGYTTFEAMAGMSNFMILDPDQIGEDVKGLALALTLIEDRIQI